MEWLRNHGKHVMLALIPLILYGVVAARFSWRPRTLPRTPNYTIFQVAFSPDGSMLAAAAKSKLPSAGPDKVQFWNTRQAALLHEIPLRSENLGSISFSPNGAFLATISHANRFLQTEGYITQISQHKVKLWDVDTGALERTLRAGNDYDGSYSFHLAYWPGPGKHTLTFMNSTRGMLQLDVLTGKMQPPRKPVLSQTIALSPDGRTGAQGPESSSLQDGVRLWDELTGKQLCLLPLDASSIRSADLLDMQVNALTFSPDGKMLAGEQAISTSANSSTGDYDYDVTILLWDIDSRKIVKELKGVDGRISSFAFSPDGHLLASADAGKMVKIWDVKQGTLLRTLEGHRKTVNTVTFSPDGTMLASGSDDGTVKLWRIR